jgi:hypothetical protein
MPDRAKVSLGRDRVTTPHGRKDSSNAAVPVKNLLVRLSSPWVAEVVR